MNGLQRFIGRALLVTAPALMKTLAVVGTVAMFLVGGGILTHSIGFMHVITDWFVSAAPNAALVMSILADGMVGVVAGSIIALVFALVSKLRK
jgi:predicted DNA repair protein MutK